MARSRMPDDMLPISRNILKMETHPRLFVIPSTSPVKTCGWSTISSMRAVGFCTAARSSGRSFIWALTGWFECVFKSERIILQRQLHLKNHHGARISLPHPNNSLPSTFWPTSWFISSSYLKRSSGGVTSSKCGRGSRLKPRVN